MLYFLIFWFKEVLFQFCFFLSSLLLTLRLISLTAGPFANSIDQDQIAQNMQPDLGSVLSNKQNEFETANYLGSLLKHESFVTHPSIMCFWELL